AQVQPAVVDDRWGSRLFRTAVVNPLGFAEPPYEEMKALEAADLLGLRIKAEPDFQKLFPICRAQVGHAVDKECRANRLIGHPPADDVDVVRVHLFEHRKSPRSADDQAPGARIPRQGKHWSARELQAPLLTHLRGKAPQD